MGGKRHFGEVDNRYKHDAQASESLTTQLTRLRVVLVWTSQVPLSS